MTDCSLICIELGCLPVFGYLVFGHNTDADLKTNVLAIMPTAINDLNIIIHLEIEKERLTFSLNMPYCTSISHGWHYSGFMQIYLP